MNSKSIGRRRTGNLQYRKSCLLHILKGDDMIPSRSIAKIETRILILDMSVDASSERYENEGHGRKG